ncbi:MAG: RNA methyltransferase [Pyrinomonadaceae bacterium]|nr:RNA methyltransferase [Pyrinomonadaceae bacterium]
MSEAIITSRQNPRAQYARAVRDGKEKKMIFAEGLRLCEEAVRSELEIVEAFFTDRIGRERRGAETLETVRRVATVSHAVSEDVLAAISDTPTPQGLILLARRPDSSRQSFAEALPADPLLLVIMHGINNPANAGAMTRVAEAAGASGVIVTIGSTDLFAPKALRGAMGSSFRLPVWQGVEFSDALAWCMARSVQTVSTALTAPLAHTAHDWTKACAIVVGAEAFGLTAKESAATESSVRIPMRPPVESLNVAVALAVILYEAERQRSHASLAQAKGKV